jgi:transcription elongation GreA/GreB family factor
MSLKENIHEHYLQLVLASIRRLHGLLADLKESGANETKSTAGDKHETALAMLQLEQEKVRNQLAEAQHQLALLHTLQPTAVHTVVASGSLVKTNRGYLYVSIAAGKTLVNDQVVIALSAQSPLGQQLLKLRAGQTATVNQTSYYIESVE